MSIEEDFQKFILTKYKSVNQFASAAGIPYTTVKGGLERGIMGMSVQTVIKMCQTLSIDVNKLANGIIEPTKKSVMLDVNEFNLINQYREIDTYGKQLLVDIATHEYNRCQSQNNEIHTTQSVKVARSFGDVSKIDRNADIDEQKLIDAPENDIDM